MNEGANNGGKVVLVTGANSGIGLATALRCAKAGFGVVGSVRSEEKAAVLGRAAKDAGLHIDSVILDVTDADRCGEVVEEITASFGPLYGLVNNAGLGQAGPVEHVSDEEIRELLETMVVGPVRLARLALPSMREGGGGRIVNISSIYGRATTPMAGWYQAAKHALEAVSDALRAEVAAQGVRVVLVEPGGFRTGIWDDMASVGGDGSRYATAYERTRRTISLTWPLMGDPEGCARVVTHVLGSPRPRARYLVGPDALLLAAASRLTPTPVWDRVSRLVLGL